VPTADRANPRKQKSPSRNRKVHKKSPLFPLLNNYFVSRNRSVIACIIRLTFARARKTVIYIAGLRYDPRRYGFAGNYGMPEAALGASDFDPDATSLPLGSFPKAPKFAELPANSNGIAQLTERIYVTSM